MRSTPHSAGRMSPPRERSFIAGGRPSWASFPAQGCWFGHITSRGGGGSFFLPSYLPDLSKIPQIIIFIIDNVLKNFVKCWQKFIKIDQNWLKKRWNLRKYWEYLLLQNNLMKIPQMFDDFARKNETEFKAMPKNADLVDLEKYCKMRLLTLS